jgi:hypothetical protein
VRPYAPPSLSLISSSTLASAHQPPRQTKSPAGGVCARASSSVLIRPADKRRQTARHALHIERHRKKKIRPPPPPPPPSDLGARRVGPHRIPFPPPARHGRPSDCAGKSASMHSFFFSVVAFLSWGRTASLSDVDPSGPGLCSSPPSVAAAAHGAQQGGQGCLPAPSCLPFIVRSPVVVVAPFVPFADSSFTSSIPHPESSLSCFSFVPSAHHSFSHS